MTIDIDVEHAGWQQIAALDDLCRTAARLALDGREGDVAIVLSGDDEIRTLNAHWRGMDKATNVLSFPAPDDMPLPQGEQAPLGDIILAFETVQREAQEQGKTLVDHTRHLIVHGILHLLGYDHDEDADATVMENRERDILAKLGISDPYKT